MATTDIKAQDIQTRKDEIRYKTNDQRRMIGKYLAKNAVKTWTEDFIDESTGEIVSVERNEILIESGKYIDADLASKIAFYIQCKELAEVEVSNQRRLAKVLKGTNLYPFKVTAVIDGKKHNFILQAQDATKAIEVATDYIELTFSQGFYITGVKWLDNVVILNDRLRSSVEATEGANEAGQEADNSEEKRDDTKYYKVEAAVTILSEGNDEEESQPYDFIVKTKDVDTAKVVITAWISRKVQEKTERDGDERKVTDISILSASPFSCNAIVDKAFCLAYKEEAE